MTAAAAWWADLWAALSGIFKLDGNAFLTALHAGDAIAVAVGVVVIAGLSETIAESIVLFANRVRAARFLMSVFVNVALFVFGYAFTVLSTWAVMALPGQHHAPLDALALVIALSYAPLVFSFFGTLPYLGVTVVTVLRIWHLLSMVVGVGALAGAPLYVALTYVGLGWFVLTVAQATIGRPIVALGARALDAAAGVAVAGNAQLAIDRLSADDAPPAAVPGGAAGPISPTPMGTRAPRRSAWWKAGLGLGAIAALTYVVALTLAPRAPRRLRLGRRVAKRDPLTARLAVDRDRRRDRRRLSRAARDDRLVGRLVRRRDRHRTEAAAAASDSDARDVERYVVYLDGISQSSSKYMPDVENFLDALAPRLPKRATLVRGVMAYSVMNRPLEDDPVLSGLWRLIDALRFRNPNSLLGMIVNLRNVLIVAVSADTRYGPMYNYSVAPSRLRRAGRQRVPPRSGIPVTLLGFSGGGQMAAARRRSSAARSTRRSTSSRSAA